MEAVASLSTEPSKSLSILKYLDEKYPSDDAVKYYLGVIAAASGKYQEAEGYYKQASFLDSTNLWYKDALGGLYAAQGKLQKSADIYLDLFDKNPSRYTNAYTLCLLGDRHLSNYQDSLAIDAYNKALLLSPGYVPALVGRAEAHRFRGNIPAFFADTHSFIKDPFVVATAKCSYLSRFLKQIDYRFYRSWGAQIDTLVNSCVRTHPTDSAALRLAGSWYYSSDRKAEGRKYFDRILWEYPQDLDAHYIRLTLLMDEGDMQQVLNECETIIDLGGEKNPEVLPALSTAGDCYHALGNDRKAMKFYDKVLAIDPRHALTLNNYAYYLSLSGKKLKKAEKMSRLSLEVEPDNPSYLDTYGWILHLLGRDKEAKPYFKRAIVYGGKDHLDILEHYSVVLDALGESDLAKYYQALAEAKKAAQSAPAK